jgi:hypothetical protein
MPGKPRGLSYLFGVFYAVFLSCVYHLPAAPFNTGSPKSLHRREGMLARQWIYFFSSPALKRAGQQTPLAERVGPTPLKAHLLETA